MDETPNDEFHADVNDADVNPETDEADDDVVGFGGPVPYPSLGGSGSALNGNLIPPPIKPGTNLVSKIKVEGKGVSTNSGTTAHSQGSAPDPVSSQVKDVKP